MEEVFKPIKRYELLYEISNLGRIKSLAKKFKFSVNYSFYTPFFRSIILSKKLKQYCIYTQWEKIN
jgi:hypothetical protein